MAPSSVGRLFVTTFAARIPAGEGTPRSILCLHGIEAHGLRFFGIARLLPGITIVAPDLRGHGQSPKAGPWTVAQHVRDVLPILENLGPAPIVLGHSFGGLVAWELARTAPDLLSGLILVDPAIAISRELAEEGKAESAANVRWPDQETAFRDLMSVRAPQASWAVALDLAVGTERDADGGLRPIVSAEAVEAGWEQMTAPIQPTDYRGPALLVEARQANGLFVSPALIAAMRGQLGDRFDHVVLDVGHSIPADRPDLLAQQVRTFVAGLA